MESRTAAPSRRSALRSSFGWMRADCRRNSATRRAVSAAMKALSGLLAIPRGDPLGLACRLRVVVPRGLHGRRWLPPVTDANGGTWLRRMTSEVPPLAGEHMPDPLRVLLLHDHALAEPVVVRLADLDVCELHQPTIASYMRFAQRASPSAVWRSPGGGPGMPRALERSSEFQGSSTRLGSGTL